MGLTTVLWFSVALLTKPDPDKLLGDFYSRIRPLGFWKPFQSEGQAQLKTTMAPILRGLIIAVTGFAAISLLIISLTELWFGRYWTGTIGLISSGALFIIFKKTAGLFLAYLANRIDANKTIPNPKPTNS
jgi:hypothetical protein